MLNEHSAFSPLFTRFSRIQNLTLSVMSTTLVKSYVLADTIDFRVAAASQDFAREAFDFLGFQP